MLFVSIQAIKFLNPASRAAHEDGQQVGALSPGDTACQIPYFGKVVPVTPYEVLTLHP